MLFPLIVMAPTLPSSVMRIAATVASHLAFHQHHLLQRLAAFAFPEKTVWTYWTERPLPCTSCRLVMRCTLEMVTTVPFTVLVTTTRINVPTTSNSTPPTSNHSSSRPTTWSLSRTVVRSRQPRSRWGTSWCLVPALLRLPAQSPRFLKFNARVPMLPLPTPDPFASMTWWHPVMSPFKTIPTISAWEGSRSSTCISSRTSFKLLIAS
mmetsp:Transcript_3051/g.4978  ORF Transcript_3051/g.4978 Transcript_3051/m.4978 type:complete len:208 (-) Transcript_3051:366-989(-)